ncbi:MAG TPA: type 4a pilus biogenesis protein PilO [Thermodesulfobacteriota bacterium]|nr:type 4a pilus biogenesis protein PilO [Thermodesulfobacteriota bacterium]
MSFLDDYSERLSEQPLHVKVGILLLIVAVISAAYWYFFWSPKAEELEKAQNKLKQEETKVREYEAIAAELPKFEEEYKRLENEFELVSRKLPKDKEIPALIDGVYSEIAASNLDSIIFAPQPQVTKEIYAEIPIEMEVIGTYFSLADFFDRISRLPRIVNVRDLQLKRNDIRGGTPILDAKFDVVTFRLLPPQETKPDDNKKTKTRKRGK